MLVYCNENRNDLISFHSKTISNSYKNKDHRYEIDRNANTTKANSCCVCSVYTILKYTLTNTPNSLQIN